MKKVLLSAALLLATSGTIVFAAAPETASGKVETATLAAPTTTPAATTTEHHAKHHHKMTKEEMVAKLTGEGEKVRAKGAKLTGLEKDLFDAAMARFDNSVKVIGGLSEKDTGAYRAAKNMLKLNKAIARHKDGFPEAKATKWKATFESLKTEVLKLTGDKKTAADLQVKNIEGLFADAEKAKDTTLAPVFLNELKHSMKALKRMVNHGKQKADAPKEVTATTTPVATAPTTAPAAPAAATAK